MSDALNISDGDITVDFADANSGYVLVAEGYRPAVAQEDPNRPELALPVDEEFRLYIEGSSPADAASKLEDLTEIVHRAARLWRGEDVDPVIYQYQIANSTLNAPLEDMVIGGPEGNAILELPSGYDSATMTSKIGSTSDPIIWRLQRRGDWLDEEESASSGTVAQPGTMACTFSGGVIKNAPVDILIERQSSAPSAATREAMIVLAEKSSDFELMEAESYIATGFSTHADADASNGSVAQKGTVGVGGVLQNSSLSIDTSHRLYYMMALVQNNSDTLSYQLYGGLQGTGVPEVNTPVRIIPPRTASNRVFGVMLGFMAVRQDPTSALLYATASAAVTSGHELEVDYFVLVGVKENTRFIHALRFLSNYDDTHIKHNLLSRRQPDYYHTLTTIPAYSGAEGNLLYRIINSSTLAAFLMVWRPAQMETTGTFNLTATRRPAYRIPR